MKKSSSKCKPKGVSGEPDWLHDDPNQGPHEYSEKDYENFADGFIRGNRDLPVIKEMIKKLGFKGALEKIKQAFKDKIKFEGLLDRLN